MKLLKKENWWQWLLLLVVTVGGQNYLLGALLDVYQKDSWYGNIFYRIPKLLLFTIIAVVITSFIYMYTVLPTNSFKAVKDMDITAMTSPVYLISSLVVLVVAIAYLVFKVQTLVEVNVKLKTPGAEVYSVSYVWILLIIIPIIGWIMLIVLYLYLEIWPLVMLYRGKGEDYV